MNTGGPAFPHGPMGDSIQFEDGRVSHQWQGSPGMDLLDWMAGQIMVGVISGAPRAGNHDRYAKDAYELAAAMLAEKARREGAVQEPSTTDDSGKVAKLEALNRELVWALDTMMSGWVDPYDDNDNVAKARAILTKAKEVA